MFFEFDNLFLQFNTRYGLVKAVRGVSYKLEPGQILGVVGESGCGKSVTHRAILGLLPKHVTQITSGRILYKGTDLTKISDKKMQAIRGSKISMIFQDPMTCLNPYLRIDTQMIEGLRAHQNLTQKEALKIAEEALSDVGISDAASRLKAYPHEFSGGMRQRVMIAMALMTNPELLIADEPTTALDVTVEAQILELIKEKQRKTGMSVIYITHNLGVVAGIADRVNVMYAGQVVESGVTDEIFYEPRHPYTKALLKSLPANHKKGERLTTIPGSPPNLMRDLIGCTFIDRCEFAEERCEQPEISYNDKAGHLSRCVRVNDLNLSRKAGQD